MKKKITKAILLKREKRRFRAEQRNKMKEWVYLVKKRDNYCCQMCGFTLEGHKPSSISAHHIIPRTVKELAFDVNNGLTLCSRCHRWSNSAAHHSALVFTMFLSNNKPEQYAYLKKWIDNNKMIFTL